MENNKNDWEKIKESIKELKSAASTIFSALIFCVAILIGIWAFMEAIFQVTLTLFQAILITVGVGLIYIIRAWWSNKWSKQGD